MENSSDLHLCTNFPKRQLVYANIYYNDNTRIALKGKGVAVSHHFYIPVYIALRSLIVSMCVCVAEMIN